MIKVLLTHQRDTGDWREDTQGITAGTLWTALMWWGLVRLKHLLSSEITSGVVWS